MFTPTERLRDSHYHSMYRTLRSARINYAAQAARFKDEGDSYKLVMDVREFLGGEITVRTAGGTLSVRGRLESGVGGDGDSAYSGTSRASSSARTLHRRFNLPPDADGEKVQSTLSRDAVLTVTIGKRTDVRVIPVTVEGDTPPSATASGRSGTKRHSATQPEPGPTPSKRSQDNHNDTRRGTNQDFNDRRDRSNSRSREPFGMGRSKDNQRGKGNDWQSRNEEGATSKGNERTSRRGSDLYSRAGGLRESDDNRRKSYPDSSERRTAEEISQRFAGNKGEENGGRRRTRDTVEEELESGQRSRRRTSKYEDAKEFHIPIRFESSDDANKSKVVYHYPAASNENISSTGDRGASAIHTDRREPQKSSNHNRDTEGIPYSSSLITKMERDKQNNSEQAEKIRPSAKDTVSNEMNEKENIRPSGDESPWVYSKLYSNDSGTDDQEKQHLSKAQDSSPPNEKKKYYFGDKPLIASNAQEVEVRVTSPEGASSTRNEKEYTQPVKKMENTGLNICGGRDKDIRRTDEKTDKDDHIGKEEDSRDKKDYLRTESHESDSIESGRKSPLEGREVTVEKKQSDMEGDMFKDCWQNFSSTLQEVLSRLQELSSELGPPKPAATPSTPPKLNEMENSTEKSTDYGSHRAVNNKVPKRDAENGEISEHRDPVSIDGNEWAAGKTGAEGGVGGTPPSTPPTAYEGLGSNARSCNKDREAARYMDASASSKKAQGKHQQQVLDDDSPNFDKEDAPLMQQVSGQNVTESVAIRVPRRSSSGNSDGEGDGGVQYGGARTRDSMIATSTNAGGGASRPVSLCDPLRHSIPMNFILDGSSTDVLGRQGSNLNGNNSRLDTSHASDSVPRPRPTSLNVSQESALLKNLRKSSPVEALKDRFLSRVTPSSEPSTCDTDIHYIPVELEASKRVTLTGNSKSEEKPLPLSSVAASSTLSTPAATLPLCERRGKGVENLVIVADDRSSNTSSQVSTSATSDYSPSATATSDSSCLWSGYSSNIKSGSGNSGIRSAGCDSFQHSQHSSSGSRGTDSRTYISSSPLDSISSRTPKGESESKTYTSVPSSALSESDPDVDEIISQAERVIQQTKRLSASITNDLPVENDLGREKFRGPEREKKQDNLKPPGFNLAPNIDTRTSPESNFVEVEEEEEEEEEEDEDTEEGEEEEDEEEEEEEEEEKGGERRSEEAESVVEGCLTIPLPGLAGRPQPPRYTPPSDLKHTAHPASTAGHAARRDSVVIEAVDDSDDDIECEEVRPTIVTSPEIRSSDVMGCARESGRGGVGGVVIPQGPRDTPPSHTLTHEAQPTRATRHAAAAAAADTARDSSMGGVFSRGRTHDSAGRHAPAQNVSSVTGRTKVASPAPPSPTAPRSWERSVSKEEPPLPPYVRQKPEPAKRYSGFGHVQSDNVRKMRDVWGTRNETSPQPTPPTPPTRARVPASPPPVPRRREAQSPRRGPDSPRRFSDTPKHRTESPSRGPDSPRRFPDYSYRRGSDSSRRGPDSPKRGPDSPKRPFFSRDSPTRDSGKAPKNNSNFYSSTISSRNKTSSSPRRGSTSSTEGAAPYAQPSATRTPAAANSPRPQHDKYRAGGWSGSNNNNNNNSKPSTPRASRRTSTPPPPAQPKSTAPPPYASAAPPASPFHHKVFRRLRDANLQPDSETICFTEEENRYKLVMDVEEYVAGEVEVLQDDKELQVKGRVETTHRGNTTTRTFHRKFHIPHNTREEDIDSALSKDGILTVYVPKKRERVIKIEMTD